MYKGFQEEKQIQIKFHWDPNTARGFAISLAIHSVLVFIVSMCQVEPTATPKNDVKLIPLELINFGLGDGTGLSKGNLSQEGAAHKGKSPVNQLEDASVAAKRGATPSEIDDPLLAKTIKPVEKLSSESGDKKSDGTGARDIGKPDGSQGTGLGEEGLGPGSGYGLGEIEWGGGGNRIVLYKVLPKYPTGYNVNAQIKIRFTVSADGSVISMVPLQKGDPVLERAAMEALRQWRFNRLKENKEMYGIITFTFRVS
ncbi:MAG: energy transducer TonB [Ignavibacteria bacterium]|nr:energy transducer TonB [Ignavibacteria bacterium]